MNETTLLEVKGYSDNVNAVDFENIVFGYSDKEKLFNGRSYSFENRKITAIVGQSGCGKSTLAQWLQKFPKTKIIRGIIGIPIQHVVPKEKLEQGQCKYCEQVIYKITCYIYFLGNLHNNIQKMLPI